MTDNHTYDDGQGRTLIADGGSAAASVDPATDSSLNGSVGFDAAVANSQYALAQYRGDKRAAKQAVQTLRDFRANSQLRKDEWTVIEDSLKRVSVQTRVMAQDLINRGLTIPLDLGTLRFEWEDVDDTGDALVDMSGETGGAEDLPDFGLNGVPLPLIHKSYRINLRKLRASRNRGEPLDATAATQATRAVNEKVEDIVANGVPNLTVEGSTIDGYTTHSSRAQPSGNATWDGASADNMIDDVMSTIEAIEDQNRGRVDMVFYINRQNFQEIRAKNAGTDDKRGVLQLVRDRLESEGDFPGVEFKRADFLDDGEAVLVEMSEETVQLAVPSDVQTMEWESNGGMTVHNKVLASMIPVLKDDRSSNIGLAHLTGI